MTSEEKDWRQLCAMAAAESDPRLLLEIVDQLIKVLDERRVVMRGSGPQNEPDSSAGAVD
ncbi:MAG: hypothetical protein WAM43_09220 [Terriglobales bacterium]